MLADVVLQNQMAHEIAKGDAAHHKGGQATGDHHGRHGSCIRMLLEVRGLGVGPRMLRIKPTVLSTRLEGMSVRRGSIQIGDSIAPRNLCHLPLNRYQMPIPTRFAQSFPSETSDVPDGPIAAVIAPLRQFDNMPLTLT